MAKRKAARSAARKRPATKRTGTSGARRRRPAARKGRKAASARPSGGKRRSTTAKSATSARKRSEKARKSRTARKSPARKKGATLRPSASRSTAAPSRKGASSARKAASRPAPKAARKGPEPRRTPTRKSTPPRAAFGKRGPGDRRPHLERDRRILEETVPGSPSTLDFDRHASSARSGREEMREALAEHTESSPRLTGGDVDADWESAFATGDEAPGGDMPTPDQDVVDEIGASLGVQYNDDEELKAVDKIEERDRHRWELDPASSDDYRDRTKK